MNPLEVKPADETWRRHIGSSSSAKVVTHAKKWKRSFYVYYCLAQSTFMHTTEPNLGVSDHRSR